MIIKISRTWLLIFGLLSVFGCQTSNALEGVFENSGQILIINGTILDGRGSDPIQDGIVVIVEDRIVFVGKAEDYSEPLIGQVIDANGGTILPGIIDAHVHSTSDPWVRRQFLMEGVTTVCDLGSPIENIPRFTEEYADQKPVARGLRAGPILTAPGGLPDAVLQSNLNYEVDSPMEARAAVIDLFERGADFIKVYIQEESGGVIHPMLAEDELAAIVDEAHGHELLVRAHVTYAFLLDDAIQAGVDTIEHIPVNSTQAESQDLSESDWMSFYESNFEKMVEVEIILVPTLDRPYGAHYRNSDLPPDQAEIIGKILSLLGWFHEMGGLVALGSDWAPGSNMQAGMPVGEMEMLLVAGLGPMDVLEAGTRLSAIACGHGDELGTLEPGKLADVIVVDGNPLEDIQIMTRVVLVIKNGEVALSSEGIRSEKE